MRLNLALSVLLLRCERRESQIPNSVQIAGWAGNKNVAHTNHWTVECQQQIYDVLCIGRKLRYFWCHSWHICRCSRTISWARWSTNFITCFYFAIYQGTQIRDPILIRNSGHTCKLSGSVDVFKSTNRGFFAREHWRTLHKLVRASDKRKKYIFEFDHMELLPCSCYVETATRKIHTLQNTPTYQAYGLPTREFAFPLSEKSMYMRLIMRLNQTSIGNSKWQRRSWRGFREEFPRYIGI